MVVNVRYEEHGSTGDIIAVPDDFCSTLNALQAEFFKWLFDERNDHPYWYYKEGMKAGCSYDVDAFISWMNNHYAKRTGEAYVLARDVTLPEKADAELLF